MKTTVTEPPTGLPEVHTGCVTAPTVTDVGLLLVPLSSSSVPEKRQPAGSCVYHETTLVAERTLRPGTVPVEPGATVVEPRMVVAPELESTLTTMKT